MGNFQETIIKVGVEYQNLYLKSTKLQISYFLVKNILQIPIICLLAFVSTSLFLNISFIKSIHLFFQNKNSQTLQIQRITLITYLLIITILTILKFQSQYKLIKQIFYILLTFSETFNKLGTFLIVSNIFNQEQFLLVRMVSTLMLIVSQIPIILRDRIFISLQGNKTNVLAHNPDPKIFFLNILEKIVFYATIFTIQISNQDSPFKKIFYSFLLLIYFAKITIYFKQKYYIDQGSNKLEILGCILSLTFLVINQVYEITNQILIIQNLHYLSFTIFTLGSLSIFSYYSYSQSQHLFISLQQIIQSDKIKRYLQTIFKLWKQRKSAYYQSIIFSFKKNHEFQCSGIHCKCKQYGQNKTNGKTQDRYIESQNFLKYYMKQNLKNLYSQIKNHNHKILILMIWLQLFDQFIQINKKLNFLQKEIQKDYQTTIQIQILKRKVKTIIQKRNGKNNMVNIIQILNLEQNITAMQDIILNDIQIKSSKWKYLCQNVCKSIDIQAPIVQQISNIIEFDKIYTKSKFNYKRSVSFNCLALFYYNQVVFLTQECQNLILNLTQLSKTVKQGILTKQKQIQKKIFNQKCCLIQFDIVPNNLGSKQFHLILKNCNKNALSVFNCNTKQKLISKGFDKIFPEFLFEEFQQKYLVPLILKKILIKYNRFILLTVLDLYFKLYISCVFIILQKQTQKLLLVNKKGYIQNIGKTFTNVFGKQYKNVPVSSLFYFQQEYNSLKFKQTQNMGNYVMFNGKVLKNSWQKYIQNVTQYIRKQKISTILKINNSHDDLTFGNPSKRHFQNFLKRQKKQLIEKQIKQKTSNRSLSNEQFEQKTKNQLIVITSLKYKKVIHNDNIFYVIVLDDIKKNKINKVHKLTLNYQKYYRLRQQNQKEQSINNFGYNVQDQINSQSSDYSQQALNQQYDDEQQNQKLMKNHQKYIVDTSSINSSLKTQNILNANNKFIQSCVRLFKNPNQINDKTLNLFTFSSLITSLLISCLIMGSFIVLKLLLYEVKDIFFADGAVSDNMQLTQFLFNRALTYKIFKNNSSVLNTIQISARFERQYLFNLIIYDYQKYETQITSMTNTKFYQYLRIPVVWQDSYNISSQIDTGQFLTLYYHLSRQVQLNIFQPNQNSQLIINNALHLMKLNFPQMERINHYNLNFYKQMSDQSLSLFKRLIFILFITHLSLFAIFFLIFYRQKIFRRSQQIEGYSIYKIIPKNIVTLIGKYYQSHQYSCGNRNDLRKYETYFESQTLLIPKDLKTIRSSNKSKFLTDNFSIPSIIWKSLAGIIMLNLAYGVIIFRINNLIGPIKLMMDNVNDLMDSQNYLIQAYINLKANFIVQNQTRSDIQFINNIMYSQIRNDVLFNRIAVNSLELFSQYESTYTSDFIQLLINDICDIAKGQFSDQIYNKCKTYFKINYNKNGVSLGMNFFTRKVRQTFQYVKKQTINLKGQNFTKQMINNYINIFKSQDYRQIDQSMFYMFKLYQITQARIYESLQKTIITHLSPFQTFAIIQIIFLEIIYTILLYIHYKRQKTQLSKLYISFLLIPTPIIKHVKDFSRKIQQILTIQNFK